MPDSYSPGTFSFTPARAGSRRGPFDPAVSIYNNRAASKIAIREKMNKARNGQRCQIAAIGPSGLLGVGATIGTTDPIIQLRQLFAGRGWPIGGTGLVTMSNNTTVDSRWNLGASWTANTPGTRAWANSTTLGAAATFTTDLAGTIADLWLGGNGGPYEYSIAGGAWTTYTGSGNPTFDQFTLTGLGLAAGQTIGIRSKTGAFSDALGVNVRNATGGIELHNLAISAAKASDWLPPSSGADAYGFYFTQSLLQPDIAIVSFDGNEALNGVSISTYKANMQTLISSLQAAGTAVVLQTALDIVSDGTHGYPAVSQALWNSFISAEYDLADQYNIPLLDYTDRTVSNAALHSSGVMFDWVHQNPQGYAEQANALYSLLAA